MGNLDLPNRIVMAPTRMRAHRMIMSTTLQAEYYAQRASAGLIIAEATAISRKDLVGRYSRTVDGEQVRGWRHVTDAFMHPAGA